MGHTGSVQRAHGGGASSSSSSRRNNPDGALYGEPLGSHPAGTVNRANYTPAQLQALYLSRGRPDLGFMSNQSMLPKDVPEMQQTSTVKNHVNLKKSSLKLVAPTGSAASEATLTNIKDLLNLEFQFDATKPCRVTVFLVALEEIDDETGCSRYSLQHKTGASSQFSYEFPVGLSQKFSLEDVATPAAETKTDGDGDSDSNAHLFDLGRFSESELIYEGGSLKFPLIIVLEALESNNSNNGDKSISTTTPQSQSTFCTFAKQPNANGAWTIKMLKQKIQVDGLTYELQEIYGIDGSLAAAPKHDPNSSEEGATTGEKKRGGLDEIDMPDGAECIICMCEPRNTTVLPCRHMCLCGECAEALRKSSSTCPICRTHVEGLLQIRVDAKDQSDSKD